MPKISFSPDFLLMTIYYVDAASSGIIVSKHVNDDDSVSELSVPSEWTNPDVIPYLVVSNSYAYFRTLATEGSTDSSFFEVFYSIDKEGNTFTSLEGRNFAQEEAGQFEKTLLIQEESILRVITETED